MKKKKSPLVDATPEQGASGERCSVAMGSNPTPGTKWMHRNGIIYEVTAIANVPPLFGHKPSVVYRGPNGKWWTRPLSDWHRSFVPLPNNGPLQVVGPGGVVGRPMHILLCDGVVRGWTADAAWAQRWADQLAGRSFVAGAPELCSYRIPLS